MELINQRTKQIMENCKAIARQAGLHFDDESLEYIVTNRDMLELSPKVMIPTLYDYWVHDVEVLKEYGKYKLYPSNPYETVINSRPAISFYNDNNPDWLNTMIFYHVLGHIDFFQNNLLFEHTWNDDFVGQALADKRLIANLRSEYGRWTDYSLEFSRSIDNISGYFQKVSKMQFPTEKDASARLSFYFDVFLQEIKQVRSHEIYNEVARYNALVDADPVIAESLFFSEVRGKYPEFDALFEKESSRVNVEHYSDILEFIRDNSPLLAIEKNSWMKSVMTIVHNTSMYFAPQIRSKIINEGWASYWHDMLFRSDEQIKGHEIAYSKTNAGVTSLTRIGLNPYAIGLRLIQYVEELANKGKLQYYFQKHYGIEYRDEFDQNTGKGREAIFALRSNFSDFMLINTFVDQDFVDMHDLFTVGQRLNEQRGTIEYYIKSRKAEDYKQMLLDSLYHPPVIEVNLEKTNEKTLYLKHKFEGKQLVKQYVPEVLIGLEYLWGSEVKLETTEIVVSRPPKPEEKPKYELREVIYHIKDRKTTKKAL